MKHGSCWILDGHPSILADMKTPVINRREWVLGTLAGFAGLNSRLVSAQDSELALDIIDCHTHFYDPTRAAGVPWPPKNSTLYRTVLPRHLKELKTFRPVTGTVVVEASPWVEDNAWLLELANDDPFIVGIVGNLTPGEPRFKDHLRRFASNELYRGIRISEKLLSRLLSTEDLTDLKLLVEHDLELDVNGGPSTPGVIAKLAGKLPALRIVQNHVGNVTITSAPPPKDWQTNIQAAARHKNVYCKISALVEGAARVRKTDVPTDLDFYRPYIDVVWDAFGDDRVIYGSNWPVSERAASYETLQRLVHEYASEKGALAMQKFFALNAKSAYKWVDRPGRI